jgi:ABC-2 type transport system ATP-binding protein
VNKNIIETTNLSKNYKRYKKKAGIKGSITGLWKREYEEKKAVWEFNLSVEEGEFIGLIGPNGAGKTTLIKMLTGIIAPSAGDISVMGFRPNDMKNEFKKKYAVVMGQKSQLFFELTVNDTLRLFKEIYEIPEKEFLTNKEYFAELFGVTDLMDVQVRTLSLGERMKMELMVALLHNPKILFLDEPTIGLDAIASKQIRTFLKAVNEEKGTTILLTSHYMEDIKALCKRSIVVNHGVKIYDGSTEELFERYQLSKKITVTFDKPMANLSLNIPNIRTLVDEPYKKSFLIPKEMTNQVLNVMMSYEPSDISIEEEEVGAVVERIYREEGGSIA